MWEELAAERVHRDQLIICQPRLFENALFIQVIKAVVTTTIRLRRSTAYRT